MANLLEPVRQHMLDEPLEESDRMEADGAPVLGPEGDLAGGHVQEAGIGDSHPVGVAPEVLVMWCTT